MRQEIKTRLVIWQKDLHDGETKRVMLSDSPAHNGEFIIKLEKAIRAQLAEGPRNVVVSRRLLTTAQANSIMDPAEDLSHLNELIADLDKEIDERLHFAN